jgi:hypothetical protein
MFIAVITSPKTLYDCMGINLCNAEVFFLWIMYNSTSLHEQFASECMSQYVDNRNLCMVLKIVFRTYLACTIHPDDPHTHSPCVLIRKVHAQMSDL